VNKITIFADGGARGNPGPAAAGVAFYNGKGVFFKGCSEFLGEATNNEAEYKAVIFALKKFKSLFGKKIAETSEVEVKSDSELMTSQLNGKFKITEPRIGNLFIEVWNLKTDFKKIKFTLIPREKNKEADKLVNEELDNQRKNQTLI
jgi:ribonuclease HI